MSHRQQAVVAAGALGLAVVAILAIGLASRPPEVPPEREVGRLDEFVALGIIDQSVVDDLRSTGEATAIVHLDTPAILDRLRGLLGPERTDELIDAMRAAFDANKDAIIAALGSSAAVVRDYEHLGAFVVTFRSEATLLATLQSGLVRAITADIPVAPTAELAPAPARGPEALSPSEFQGTGAFVGVLDTGVDAASFPQYFPGGSVAGTFEAAPEDGAPDDHGHGTHVSSTILLMAPQARLYVADVFHIQPRGTSGETANLASPTNTLAGMDWLIGLRRSGVDLRAVNISLGSGHYPPSVCHDWYHLAEANAAGIIPVGSAGNSAFLDDLGVPTSTYQAGMGSTGCDPNVLSVGAVSDGSCADGRFDTVAEFSQSGEGLDILAPGECIVAAGGPMSGTSMAAPHVSGAVAVLASARAATSHEIWTALVTTGPLITDRNSGIVRHRLDIPAAVAALVGSTGPLPTPEIAPTRGVATSVEGISPAGALEPGQRVSLDTFAIRNTGSIAATYRLVIGGGDVLGADTAPAEWISISPTSIDLAPDELGFISTELAIPEGAAPGDYAAQITPVDDAASASEGALPVRVTFTIRSSGGTESSGGSGGSGSSGTGDDEGDLALLDDPLVLVIVGLILLFLLARFFRRPRQRQPPGAL